MSNALMYTTECTNLSTYIEFQTQAVNSGTRRGSGARAAERTGGSAMLEALGFVGRVGITGLVACNGKVWKAQK